LLELPSSFTFQVICGTTGSGKSRLLQTLEMEGAQVLDLEHLAAHRGSVLGNIPAQAQPSQKMFESSIWQKLRHFNTDRVVYIESESKKVGNLRVPDALIEKMRASACIALTLTPAGRVKLLIEDYAHFIDNPTTLNTQLDCLATLHGYDKINQWKNLALSGQMEQLVNELLTDHYDPAYKRSIHRNFSNYPRATMLALSDITEDAFHEVARQLLCLQAA
jgi:tRNA 2-selenouridine synthase